jgi:hypothetical protein
MVSKKFVTFGTVIVSMVGVLCLRQSSGAQGLAQSPSVSSEVLPTLSQLSDHGESWLSGSLAQEQAISENDRKMLVQQRYAMERELEGIAVIDRKVWIPMRDGDRWRRTSIDREALRDECQLSCNVHRITLTIGM